MRSRSALLIVFLLTGCSGRTVPFFVDLTEPDAGTVDSGGTNPIDGGTFDAGFRDGGVVSNVCTVWGSFSTGLSPVTRRDQFYEGPALIIELEPLLFDTMDGDIIEVAAPIEYIPDEILEQRFAWLEYASTQPWWTNVAFGLSDIDPRGGRGARRFAAWSIGDDIEFDELFENGARLGYVEDGCEPTDEFGCGPVTTRNLRYDGPTGVRIVARPGEVQTRGNVTIANGVSFEYEPPGPQCTDTPNVWFDGLIAID